MNKFSISKFIGFLSLLLSFVLAPQLRAAVTITGSNLVVYDIVDDNAHTVKISTLNKSQFSDRQVDLVIPTQVYDTSNSVSSDQAYTVVGFNGGSTFVNTKVKSIKFEAPITEIPASTFEGCSLLETVEFPTTVTSIGSKAFYNCSSLTSVTDLENVTSIGTNAFYQCYALAAITFGENLRSIGENGFYKCTSLTSVDIPDATTSLGKNVFFGCSAMTDAKVGKGVATLPQSAFESCTSLTDVTLSEGLTKIDTYGFRYCYSLKAPKFPSTLVNFGSYCFYSCTSLGKLTLNAGMELSLYMFQKAGITEIVWPEQKLTLARESFEECTGLTSVTIPGYISEVPASCFNSCPDLTSITIEEGVTKLGSRAFYKCTGLTTLTLPESLETIDSDCFQLCSRLTDFDFPATMTSIGSSAFSGCDALEHLKLPAGGTIGSSAFANTTLKSITFPEDPILSMTSPFYTQNEITEITIPGWMTTVPASLCSGWKGLKKLTMKEGVEAVGKSAFSDCSSLTDIVWPETTFKTIGDKAFYGIPITATNFPNTLVSIGEEAFRTCGNLQSIELPSSMRTVSKMAFFSCPNVTSIIMHDGLEEIGENAFWNMTKITIFNLPNTLKRVGPGAFASSNLPGLTLPASLEHISCEAFRNTTGYTSVSLPTGVSIERGAFYGSTINEVVWPDEPCYFLQTGSGTSKYFQSTKITKVELPEWMTEVPAELFSGCQTLVDLTFAPLTTSIGDEAFYNCDLLHDLDFPATLSSIGAGAFQDIKTGSYNFGKVTIKGDCAIGANAFKNTSVTEIVFEGCPSIDTDAFAGLASISKITFPSCMPVIPDGFCKGWSSLQEVNFLADVTTIGEDAFNGCKNLTSIILPETLQTIGAFAFKASGLTSIELPESIQKIGAQAFYGTKLTEFTFPDHPTQIAYGLLSTTPIMAVEIPKWMERVPTQLCEKCTSLTEVTFAERLAEDADIAQTMTIGAGAFAECSHLTEVTFPNVPTTLEEHSFAAAGLTEIHFANVPLFYNKTTNYNTDGAFIECNSLTHVEFPDEVKAVGDRMFYSCKNLTTVDFGNGVETIGSNAFNLTGIKEITWSPVLTSIGASAFASTAIVNLSLPSTIKVYDKSSVFDSCKSLETLTIPEGCEELGSSMFQHCSSLKEVVMPSTMKYISGYCFYQCTGLTSLTLNEGLTSINGFAFNNTRIVDLVLPSTLISLGSQVFAYNPSLLTVTNHAPGITLGNTMFWNDNNLKTFTSDVYINKIGNSTFENCTSLEKFNYPEDLYIWEIDEGAFRNCTSLKEFPYSQRMYSLGSYAFKGCTALKYFSLPEFRAYNHGDIKTECFKDCSDLQSLTFSNTDANFNIIARNIEGAPLKALSFSNATFGDGESPTQFTGRTDATLARPELSTLVVPRGQKFKYVDAGYDKLFTIVEEKAPEIRIEGDIFSTFDGEDNVNHYQSIIRWKVPLSDLNQERDTEVEVIRDEGTDREKKIAHVVFSKPSEPIATAGLEVFDRNGNKMVFDTDYVIKVGVTIDGKTNDFYGDFDFLTTDKDGNPIYEMRYGYESADMYFDAKSHRRIVGFEEYGYDSWFVMVDNFDSPDLTKGAIPERYIYSAIMKGYSYDYPYNYPDLEPDTDGHYWTTDRKTIPDLHSIDCTMYVAMASPTIDGNGFYSIDQITNDTQHSLNKFQDGRGYTLAFDMDEALMQQKGHIKSTGEKPFIMTSVKVIDITSGQNDTITTYELGDNRTAHQGLNLSNLTSVKPGQKYQTVATSLFRGTFGSPVITIPEAPALTATFEPYNHADHFAEDMYGHPQAVVKAVSHLTPIVEGMGYEGNHLSDGDYHLGVWRTLTRTDNGAPILAAATNFNTAELLNHVESPEDICSTECDECDQERSLEASDTPSGTLLTYSDVYGSPLSATHDINYDHRLYVKVPSSMIPGDTRYMLADTNVGDTYTTVSGVENVSIDAVGHTSVRWYDLQGRPVSTPIPGHTYLRVTPAGSAKVIFGN